MKKTKNVFGRFLENLGIAFVAGALLTFSMVDFRYWYFLLIGASLTVIGAYIYEKA